MGALSPKTIDFGIQVGVWLIFSWGFFESEGSGGVPGLRVGAKDVSGLSKEKRKKGKRGNRESHAAKVPIWALGPRKLPILLR